MTRNFTAITDARAGALIFSANALAEYVNSLAEGDETARRQSPKVPVCCPASFCESQVLLDFGSAFQRGRMPSRIIFRKICFTCSGSETLSVSYQR
jgi:hypothetical protein